MGKFVNSLKIAALSALLVSCKFFEPRFSTELQQGNSFDTKQMEKVKVGTSSTQLIKQFGLPALTHPYKANTNWVYLKYDNDNEKNTEAEMIKFVITLNKNHKITKIKKFKEKINIKPGPMNPDASVFGALLDQS